MSSGDLDRLAHLAKLLESARLARFREVAARARAIDEKIAALGNSGSGRDCNSDIQTLAQLAKWQLWQRGKISRLQNERRTIAAEMEEARQAARIALGRVEAINQIAIRETEVEKRLAERRAAL
ncbi:MAG: hypothetical protein KDA67_12695 [Rhodobacteraceae bacterium]|nr:hypothetical protein [Paracoccaceae bacterium]